jgi:hypothetical protein
MNTTTRAYALRAAAKAALTFSLTACGGVTEPPDPSDKKAERTIAGDAAAAQADASPRVDARAAVDLGPCPGLVADAAVSNDSFGCCLTFLEDGADAGVATTRGGEACCGAVVSYVDHATVPGAYGAAEPVLSACCSSLHPLPVGEACTPWGPPVPPAMPSEVA